MKHIGPFIWTHNNEIYIKIDSMRYDAFIGTGGTTLSHQWIGQCMNKEERMRKRGKESE